MKIISEKYHPFILFFLFSVIYSLSCTGGVNSGDGSTYSLTKALGETGSPRINDYIEYTYGVDYADINGNFYLDREPGLSYLSVPFYLTAKIIAPFSSPPYPGTDSQIGYEGKIQVFTYLTTAVFGALSVVMIYLISRRFSATILSSLIASVIFGLGTLNWKYSAAYFREPVFSSLFLASFYFLILSRLKNLRYLLFSGFLLGLSLFVDYSKFYLLLFFLIYILFKTVPSVSKKTSVRPAGKKLYSKATISMAFLIGLTVMLIIIFYYNDTVFGSPLTNPHLHKTYFQWMRDPKNLFNIPLIPGIMTNLINNGPIKAEVLTFFTSHPDIAKQYAVELYHTWSYKGILIQSPYLVLGFIGLLKLFKNNRFEIIFIFLCSVLIFMVTSKLSVFWGSINQDSRYFLPVVAMITLGLPFFLDWIFSTKNLPIKSSLLLITLFLSLISVYNGWYSDLTQFAPDNTGFYRFELKYLQQPFLSPENFRLLFLNTFPNIFNLPLLIIYALLFLGVYLGFCRLRRKYHYQ